MSPLPYSSPQQPYHNSSTMTARNIGGTTSSLGGIIGGLSGSSPPPPSIIQGTGTAPPRSGQLPPPPGCSSATHHVVVCLTPESTGTSPLKHFSFTVADISKVFDICGPTKACRTFYYPPTPSSQPSLPFADVEFHSGLSAADAIANFNGIYIPGVGTLQIYRLQPEEVAEDRAHIIYTTFLKNISYPTPASLMPPSTAIKTTEALKQLATLLSQMPAPPPETHTGVNLPKQGDVIEQQQSPAAYTARSRPIYMARLELVDLFGSEDFDVTAAVLGEQDRNIHYILEQTETRVSISLKGVPANQAPVAERLHMALTSESKTHFDRAVEMVEDLIQAVCQQYVQWCVQRRIKISPNVGFVRHEYIGSTHSITGEPVEDKWQYLGQQERPRIWLDDVPRSELLVPRNSNPISSQTPPAGLSSMSRAGNNSSTSDYHRGWPPAQTSGRRSTSANATASGGGTQKARPSSNTSARPYSTCNEPSGGFWAAVDK